MGNYNQREAVIQLKLSAKKKERKKKTTEK